MAKQRINYLPLSSSVSIAKQTRIWLPGIKDKQFRHYSHYLNTTVIYQRHQPYPTPSTTIRATMARSGYQESKMMIGALYSWKITVLYHFLSLSADMRLADFFKTVIYQRHQPYPTPSTTIRATMARSGYQESKMMIGALYSWKITVLYHFLSLSADMRLADIDT